MAGFWTRGKVNSVLAKVTDSIVGRLEQYPQHDVMPGFDSRENLAPVDTPIQTAYKTCHGNVEHLANSQQSADGDGSASFDLLPVTG